MKTLSIILAVIFSLVGPSMAGSSDAGFPGIGTFSYHGTAVATDAPTPIVMAAVR